ncbi:hypothetical protein PSQ19_06190 [Devosia algicola]|uniref:Uncharacterized protein n=1 Tax=Devosia algicola TaxID=3026418 RepID=A0ABY7YR35_9HYPH|nr:hypothetical protein [Devosia algicola]WDR03657.1 hypothetical protein PSQ19_06190 [Devosia algicola]
MNRTLEQYRDCTAQGVASGSTAQMQYFVDDAKADIAELAAREAQIRGLLWFAWNEFNAIRARSGAPLSHDGMTLCSEEWWSQMTDAFAAVIGPDSTNPWPTPEAKAAIPQSDEGLS